MHMQQRKKNDDPTNGQPRTQQKCLHLFPAMIRKIEELKKAIIRIEGRKVNDSDVVAEAVETFEAANPHLLNGALPEAEFEGAVLHGDEYDYNGFLDEGDFYRAIDLSERIIWVAGVDGNCMHVSPMFSQLTGLPREGFRDGRWRQQIHPDDVEEAERKWLQAFALKQEYMHYVRLHRYDGEWEWVFTTARPRYRRNGQYAGYVGTLKVMPLHSNGLAK